ncbi:MAG: DUF2202 domain-containing protein [Cyclobacteriaceae bacterium]
MSVILLGLILAIASCEVSESQIQLEDSTDQVSLLPQEPINDAEEAALTYMIEEEKVARDVYNYLHNMWNHKSFQNIASSEQKHIDAVLSLIEKYELEDPVGTAQAGEFQNEDLQGLYDELTEIGSVSLENALKVGGLIEEVDIVDLQDLLNNGIDNQDIILVFHNLMKGSRNHLRSYVDNLSKIGVIYNPSYLSAEEYEDIITSPMEKGAGN